jgi:putative hydrolase of the HAD superfamily
VRDWIFDLDNTLYPASCNLFDQVDRRIGEFIARLLDLGPEEARLLQKAYFREHGTTLRGLMTVHGIEPAAFLDYVHDIDVGPVPPNPRLAAALRALDGRKVVFTNGSTAHAARILERLGIQGAFADIVDIVACDYLPKPDPAPYARLVGRLGLDPRAAAMVEDIPRNLAPAHALGMTTVLVHTGTPWSLAADDLPFVDHRTDDLTAWLEAVVAARRLRPQPDGAAGTSARGPGRPRRGGRSAGG